MITKNRLFSIRHFSCAMILLSIIVFLQPPCHGSATYYYLHVGSFQSRNNATGIVERLHGMGLPTVVRGEEIAQRGYWYRVYVGPFSVRLDAELMSREIRKRGITDYTKIIAKKDLLYSNLEEVERPSPPTAPEIIPPATAAVISPSITAPIEPPPAETSPPAAGPPPPPPPSMEGERAEEGPAPPSPPPSKPAAPKTHRQRGRNVLGGQFAVGLKHRFRKVYTLVTKRTEITSIGITPITLGGEEKDDFPTSLHMTTLCVRFGLTDYWEVFADIGTSYNEPSKPGAAHGGGMRLNLFSSRTTGIYTALQAAYMGGDFEEKYTSNLGNAWRRETVWEEVMAGLEVGITRQRWSFYVGGVYLMYEEDTDRYQVDNLPPALTYRLFRDEVEGEKDIGTYIGVAFSLTPSLLLTLEGHLLTQEGLSLSLEHLFR